MNRNMHLLSGGLAGTGTYLIEKNKSGEKPTPSGLIMSLGGGALTGILPDILEPATSSNHRGFFHSISFGILIVFLLPGLFRSNFISERCKIVLSVLRAAYGSHLVLDSFTPRGLPLFANDM